MEQLLIYIQTSSFFSEHDLTGTEMTISPGESRRWIRSVSVLGICSWFDKFFSGNRLGRNRCWTEDSSSLFFVISVSVIQNGVEIISRIYPDGRS